MSLGRRIGGTSSALAPPNRPPCPLVRASCAALAWPSTVSAASNTAARSTSSGSDAAPGGGRPDPLERAQGITHRRHAIRSRFDRKLGGAVIDRGRQAGHLHPPHVLD